MTATDLLFSVSDMIFSLFVILTSIALLVTIRVKAFFVVGTND